MPQPPWLTVQKKTISNRVKKQYAIVFLLFGNLKIRKQDIEMQFFSKMGCGDSYKMGSSPSSYIQVPPPGGKNILCLALIKCQCQLLVEKSQHHHKIT